MLTLFFVHLAGLVSPGPDFFYVVRQSASHSQKAGLLAATGIGIGISFWASFAIFGLAWLSSVGEMITYLIMILGGSYLSYLGIKMASVKTNITFAENPEELRPLNAVTEIRKGILINIFNAKAGVYFSSVISAFIGQFNQLSVLIELLLMFVFSTLLYFCVIALLFSRRPVRQFYAKFSRYIDNIAGVIFIGFGLKLLYEGIRYFL